MIDIADPKLFKAGACCAARRYAGALTNSVSAETVRIRRIPSRYFGDMCWSALDQLAGGQVLLHLLLGPTCDIFGSNV